MTNDKLMARANAEGISIEGIKQAILADSRNQKTMGESRPNTKIPLIELAGIVSKSESFAGGYLYPGDSWSHFQEGVHFPLHWVKNHDKTEIQISVIVEILQSLPIGEVVDLEKRYEKLTRFVWVKTSTSEFTCEYIYSQEQEDWENLTPVFLTPGVRNRVAMAVSNTTTTTFNQIFDLAVKDLEGETE